MTPQHSCRICGCTNDNACVHRETKDRCHWVEPDLCSACIDAKSRFSYKAPTLRRMSDVEFTALLNGQALSHPLSPRWIARLANALRAVVGATGDDGAEALRRYCAALDGMDL
jgi:hypothetical protein